jgi:hypothetical protein
VGRDKGAHNAANSTVPRSIIGKESTSTQRSQRSLSVTEVEKWTTLQNILRDHSPETIDAHYEKSHSQNAGRESSVLRLPNLSVVQEETSQGTTHNGTVAESPLDVLALPGIQASTPGGELFRV